MDQRPSRRSSEWALIETKQMQSRHQQKNGSSLDEAFKFIQVANANVACQNPAVANIRQIGRKIDCRVLPILTLCILVQRLDQIIFEHAAVNGMKGNMAMSKEQFALIQVLMSVGSVLGLFLSAVALIKVPTATWLAGNFLAWSVSTGCMAVTRSYAGLVVCRILAGVFEASTIPCLTMITSSWYRKSEQELRFCVWSCGVGAAQILGPFICYGFDQINSPDFADWRIKYVVLGGFGIILGLWTLSALPSDPMAAAGGLLTTQESVVFLNYVSSNRTTIKNTTFSLSHLKSLWLDPQAYLLVIVATSISLAYSMTDIMIMAVSVDGSSGPIQQTIFTACTGIFSIALTLCVGFLLQYTPWTRVASTVTVMLIVSIGTSILACTGQDISTALEHSHDPPISSYVVLSLGNVASTAMALVLSYAAANIAGATKRVCGICLMAVGFPLGKLCASAIRWTSTSQQNLQQAGFVSLGGCLVAIFTILILWMWYVFANMKRENYEGNTRQKDREKGLGSKTHGDEWINRTDQQDRHFYYAH